jgi:hypothetical protein
MGRAQEPDRTEEGDMSASPRFSDAQKTLLSTLGTERMRPAALVEKVETEHPDLSPDDVRVAFWSLFNQGYVESDRDDPRVYESSTRSSAKPGSK